LATIHQQMAKEERLESCMSRWSSATGDAQIALKTPVC
jgi:hypothetical protein